MRREIGIGEVDRHIEGECSFLETGGDPEARINREAGHQYDIQVRPWIDPVACARSEYPHLDAEILCPLSHGRSDQGELIAPVLDPLSLLGL